MLKIHQFWFFLQGIIAITIERIPSTNPIPGSRQMSLVESFPDLNISLLFGGYLDSSNSYNDLWSFNIVDSLWEKISPNDNKFPVARYCGGSFTLQNSSTFCIFGGGTSYGPLSDIWCFNLSKSLWEEVETWGDIPDPRILFGYTSWVENDISYFIVFGGKTSSGLNNDLFRLDTNSWTWTKMGQYGDIPPSTTYPNIAYQNNTLYVVATELGQFYKYDLSSETWTNLTSKNSYAARIMSNSYIYNDEIYLLPGDIDNQDYPEWYKLNLNDPLYEWSKVELNRTDYGVDSYGSTIIGSRVYIFGGYRSSLEDIVNNFAICNLEKNPVGLQVHDQEVAPEPRMHHKMQSVGKYLLLFGGIGGNELIFNDFWEFDCDKEKWKALRPSGVSPTGRYGYASSSYSDVMMIWGGIGSNGLLNDGYTYDFATNTFYQWSHSENVPSPRQGACLAVYGQLIVIYGGMTSAGLSNELWVYDSAKKVYTLLDSGNYDGPGALSYASCVLTKDYELYVMFGMRNDVSLGEVFKYNFSKSRWTNMNNYKTFQSWARSLGGVVKVNDKVLVVGGQLYTTNVSKDIFYLNITSNNIANLGSLKEYSYSFAYAYYQNYFYIHGGGTAIGEIMKPGIPTNKFYRIHLGHDSNWICSPGTYQSEKCEVCPPGTYSEDFGVKQCTKCRKGYYNPNYGSSSGDSCYPCEEDTYNGIEGAAQCRDCPSSSSCKAGSISYQVADVNESDISDQPTNYKADMKDADTAVLSIQIILGLLGLFIIIAVVTSKSNSNLLVKIDLYTTYHNNTIGKAMFLLKTKFGGAFTIVFIIIAIIIMLDALVNYSLNNILELKSMIPLVVLDGMTEFEGNFQIKTTLMHYGGNCLKNDECSSEIGYTISNITGDWSGITCEYVDEEDCIVSIECKNCKIPNQGQLSYQLINTNGFTSGFRVQINSSSSIPNKISSIEKTVYPNKDYIFIGPDPTTIYFSLIPSWFKDEKDGVSFSGFHISLDKDSLLGSMHKTNEVGISYNSYLTIEFNKSLNGLVTKRSIIQTSTALLSSLLGSIFGLMSSIGGVMQIVEKKWNDIEAKYLQKSPFAIAKNNSKTISQTYEESPYENSPTKRDRSNTISDSPLTSSYMII
ncbi:unnamed protein product [Blepharisma stoltei]|uniref:Tyrosine-protein kinase ephrin type A/B receptor-like domain-containing protein n=1 Tax=Blepharisma stoltei TaxID=1481888 RepID=A0AAU9KSR6_9CILI|nr:unnamed protein product [Blepharisma stoltei]